jgi:uncharacterized protein (DUF1501 family)
MKRRDFIKLSAVGSIPILAGWNTTLANALQAQINCSELHDRIMVVIILPGGLDSINFLIPIKHSDIYYNLRPNLGIRNYLPLTADNALHPELGDLRKLYHDGKVSFVDAIGYESTSGSHFTSMDLVLAGGGGTSFPSKGGTAGRIMESIYPYYPIAFPNGDNLHPIALQFGSLTTSNIMLNTKSTSMGLTQFDDVADFHEMITSVGGPLTNLSGSGQYKKHLNYIKDTEQASNQYANNLKSAWDTGKNYVTWRETYHQTNFQYPTNMFAGPLKAAARLINGGCDTRLYVIRPSGNLFDTHSNQAGQFGVLSYYVSTAIADFLSDIKQGGQSHRVLGLTLSEFGRQIRENSGGGTDHGTYYASTLFGDALIGGVHGDAINISASQYNRVSNKNYDYRELIYLYAKNWLGLDQTRLEHSELWDYRSTSLDVISGSNKAPSGCYSTFSTEPDLTTVKLLVGPNPSSGTFVVKTEGFTAGCRHEIHINTVEGRSVYKNKFSTPNLNNEVSLRSAGTYILRVHTTYPSGRVQVQNTKIVIY